MSHVVQDNVASDLAHAIVLAGVRHEETLQTFEEGPKRKSRWSECKVAKRGKRWGQPDDKPYKPLCYVDLPMGLNEKEIDQFLREQRLEDLHRKIQAHELEDHDPDIRPPSPPPVYDKAGNRLNTRDIRIRKAMTAEYNRLIRYMIKHVEGYLPPVDWKPAKLLKKIIIPIEKFPQAPFMGVIIGPRGVNHKRLQDTTGCKIFIRGRDIGDKWQSDEEAAMPQHVHIEGETEEQILAAERLIEPLLNPESPEFEYARTHGMQQLAMVNGFTLNKAEQRCGICGALGHLGFECPETNNQNYKMANVVCTICGDKGHVASDCKKAAEANKRDNVDWKQQAEAKAQMDKDFGDMMNEMGSMQNPAGAMAPAGQQLAANTALTPRPAGVPGMGAPGSGVDKSILCPSHLVGKLIGPAGATIKKLAMDTGAQINMDSTQAPTGGKAVIITAADPVVRERAKMAVSQWIKENTAAGMPMGAAAPRPLGTGMLTGQPGQQPPQQPGALRPVAPLNAPRPQISMPGQPGLMPPRPAGAVGMVRPPGLQTGPPGMRPPMQMPGGGAGGPPGGAPPQMNPGMRPSMGGPPGGGAPGQGVGGLLNVAGLGGGCGSNNFQGLPRTTGGLMPPGIGGGAMGGMQQQNFGFPPPQQQQQQQSFQNQQQGMAPPLPMDAAPPLPPQQS
mmetsp:Transcript_133875/g.346714  ORF Transcript_133875/g.346714 Transcript_133875/m.346714 type:complete len:673 (-) Transcript_133875:215-2233(-)